MSSTVRGRIPNASRARRAHLREWRRESLWLWPAVAALCAWAAGDLAARYLHSFTFHQGIFPVDLDDARTLLATIAAALLTFTGVVFSITLVALQMASSQYSPRVLRTFVRKPVTKLALSIFIATFVYSLALLSRIGTTSGVHTVPQGAVALAYLLVMASVLVFVFFVHSTVRSMRVTYVLEAVFLETMDAVGRTFVPAAAYRDVPAPALEASPVCLPFEHKDAVLDGVDAQALVALARRDGCVLRLRVPVGAYLPAGADLVEVHGGVSPRPGEILSALDCGAVRSLYQDPGYGVRQLVDVASRALSPAVNDPTTAVQAIDRLWGVLRAVGDRPDPSGVFLDDTGAVRLIVPVPGWDRLFDLAFTEIALFGAGSPQVSRKLTAVFDDLAACVTAERHGVIASRASWLCQEVPRRHDLGEGLALPADVLGLG